MRLCVSWFVLVEGCSAWWPCLFGKCLAEGKHRAGYLAYFLNPRCHVGLPDCIFGMSCADLLIVSVAYRGHIHLFTMLGSIKFCPTLTSFLVDEGR